jgi:hypothetical protein
MSAISSRGTTLIPASQASRVAAAAIRNDECKIFFLIRKWNFNFYRKENKKAKKKICK